MKNLKIMIFLGMILKIEAEGGKGEYKGRSLNVGAPQITHIEPEYLAMPVPVAKG